MLKRISYPISSKSPLYPGTPPISFHELKSIAKGDSVNTTLISLSSHSGTHIDVPRHFCPDGKTVQDLLGERLEISLVYCIDVPAKQKKPIRISDIQPLIEQIPDAAGLFIRTGMYQTRATDNNRYCSSHPWIHPELPLFLRISLPSMRLFGTDTISISNPQHRDEGRQCHRAFLCEEKPIVLAEDLDLSDPSLSSAPLVVTIYPWILDDLDGVPIHAFAELMHEYNKHRQG
jgi:kynurenine formamidase